MSKVASTIMPIWDIPPTSIAMGADRPIEGLSATERKLIALLHCDPEEWKKNRAERRRGGDFLSRTPLGKKSIERSVNDENRTNAPVFGGFRESR